MPFVLTIRERGNSWAGRPPFSTVYPTRAESKAELVAYVKRNWDVEFEDEQPTDEDEMIRYYFGEVLEAYEISEVSEDTPASLPASH